MYVREEVLRPRLRIDFRCIFHGDVTRNHRKLEDMVEKDSEGKIVSNRKKKTHGLANARGLTGAKVGALELKACEELARTRAAVTPEAGVIGVLVQDTAPRPEGSLCCLGCKVT